MGRPAPTALAQGLATGWIQERLYSWIDLL
jgi:hypothetical protein